MYRFVDRSVNGGLRYTQLRILLSRRRLCNLHYLSSFFGLRQSAAAAAAADYDDNDGSDDDNAVDSAESGCQSR